MLDYQPTVKRPPPEQRKDHQQGNKTRPPEKTPPATQTPPFFAYYQEYTKDHPEKAAAKLKKED